VKRASTALKNSSPPKEIEHRGNENTTIDDENNTTTIKPNTP
jgi:hypothetical protein